ncbi:MAG TPA: hypothetical protein PLV64_22430 [Anaerolineales bacterium]|jgi:hypothetical protein|nr:hypothetical protein [Anaerolineales bacterium]
MRIGNGTLLFILVILILILVGLTYSGGLSVGNLNAKAKQAVEAQGYTDVTYTGFEYWACGEDAKGYNFQATHPSGVRVNLTACTENGVIGINKSFWVVSR